MSVPERYAIAVPEITDIWGAKGTFNGQARVWEAHVQARHALEGSPNFEEFGLIKNALFLTTEEVTTLNEPRGHETVKLQRLIQAKLPASLRNFIHKGATSSDVLDTNLALQALNSLNIYRGDNNKLITALMSLTLLHKDTIQVGRTHGQHAIPQTFGRQVLGWYAAVKEGNRRIQQAKDVISFGKWSGEIGTHAFVSPQLEEKAMELLGLKPEPTPTQIIPRWRHAEVLSNMALNALALEKMAIDIRLLALTDIGEVREPFDEHGSSAMPHKRNPELAERICGLARVTRGAMLEQHEAGAPWLERDISHSSTERITFPVSFATIDYETRLGIQIIKGLVVFQDRMAQNLDTSRGGIYSARLLNMLIDRGVDRTEAYDTIKRLAQTAYDEKSNLKKLVTNEPLIVEKLSKSELKDAFDPKAYLQNIGVAYQRMNIDIENLFAD